MSNSQEMQKTLEVKIRPYPAQNSERSDLKGASRVHLNAESLRDLNLKSGSPCYLWKVGDGIEIRREAVAWVTTEKNLRNGITQTSKAFQEAYGFKLGDDAHICAGGEIVTAATSVVLRDVTLGLATNEVAEIEGEDLSHWEWFLAKDALSKLFMFHIHSSLLPESEVYYGEKQLISGRSCGSCICWYDLQEYLSRGFKTNFYCRLR